MVWPHHSFSLSFKRRSPDYIRRDIPRFLGQGFKVVQLTRCLIQMHGVYLPEICDLDHNAVERPSKSWREWVGSASQRETATAGISSPKAWRGTEGKLVHCCREPTPRLATSYCQNQILLDHRSSQMRAVVIITWRSTTRVHGKGRRTRRILNISICCSFLQCESIDSEKSRKKNEGRR